MSPPEAQLDQDHAIRRMTRRLKRLGRTVSVDKHSAAYLAGLGFDVATVFDIGVAGGTQVLYDAFPDAKFALLEPIAEYEGMLRRRWGDRLDFDFHACAVGAEEGSLTLSIPKIGDKVMGTRATLADFGEAGAQHFSEIDSRLVPVRRLDDVAAGYAGPFGLKIDTEGFEVEVLKGAGAFLKNCAFVMAEVSVRRRYENGYRFSDFTAAMAAHGFEIHDFLRPPGPGQSDCDAIFAPYESPLFDHVDRRLARMARG